MAALIHFGIQNVWSTPTVVLVKRGQARRCERLADSNGLHGQINRNATSFTCFGFTMTLIPFPNINLHYLGLILGFFGSNDDLEPTATRTFPDSAIRIDRKLPQFDLTFKATRADPFMPLKGFKVWFQRLPALFNEIFNIALMIETKHRAEHWVVDDEVIAHDLDLSTMLLKNESIIEGRALIRGIEMRR